MKLQTLIGKALYVDLASCEIYVRFEGDSSILDLWMPPWRLKFPKTTGCALVFRWEFWRREGCERKRTHQASSCVTRCLKFFPLPKSSEFCSNTMWHHNPFLSFQTLFHDGASLQRYNEGETILVFKRKKQTAFRCCLLEIFLIPSWQLRHFFLLFNSPQGQVFSRREAPVSYTPLIILPWWSRICRLVANLLTASDWLMKCVTGKDLHPIKTRLHLLWCAFVTISLFLRNIPIFRILIL